MEEQISRIPELDEVRSWIEEYAKKVANLKDQKGKEIELLYLRGRIGEWLSFYHLKGAFVDPEVTRVGNFDALLAKQSSLFMRIVNRKALRNEREKLNPPREQWWWWIDEKLWQEKKIKIKRNLVLFGIVGAVLCTLYFLVFRLPPQEQKYLNTLGKAERLIDETKWEEAIEACQEGIAIFPERPTPYVIMACLYEKLGDNQKAQEIFAQAATLYPQKSDFLLEKAMWYFRLQIMDKSLATISELLKEDPENLSALNLLGSIYEVENKIAEAIKAYEKLLDLAEQKGELNLIPVTKMKIGMLQLRLPLSIP